MELIKVDKAALMEKLIHNRDLHRSVFEAAQLIYRERMIAELDAMLNEARRGDKIRRVIMLPEPEDHTKDYDRALGMLAMSVDTVIELDEADYEHYVLDEWGWQRSFAANTVSYTEKHR